MMACGTFSLCAAHNKIEVEARGLITKVIVIPEIDGK
jgi:hypothetical protein